MTTNEPRWAERPDGSVWVSHWTLKESEVAKLSGVGELTLWNVKFPAGFGFAALDGLRFLDIRGGSKPDLSELAGCDTLQGLVVNQVRGLTDITAVTNLVGLRILSLYGLAKVESLPDMSRLTNLERLDLGQLRSLTDWQALTSPPQLRELFFHNLLRPDPDVIDRLASHPTLRNFDWVAPDVPAKAQDPIRARLAGLAKSRAVRPEEWLRSAGKD